MTKTENKKLWLVETMSESCDEGEAMLFDSIWTTKEKAEEYCKRFSPEKHMGGWNIGWKFQITDIEVDKPY